MPAALLAEPLDILGSLQDPGKMDPLVAPLLKERLLFDQTRPIGTLPPSLDSREPLDNLTRVLVRHGRQFVSFECLHRLLAGMVFRPGFFLQFKRVRIHASSIAPAGRTVSNPFLCSVSCNGSTTSSTKEAVWQTTSK